MSGKNHGQSPSGRRGNGEWLAYGLSALTVLTIMPVLWELSLNIYAYVLFPQMGEMWLLAYIVCGLLMVISFFGLVVVLSLGVRAALFKIMTRMSRR